MPRFVLFIEGREKMITQDAKMADISIESIMQQYSDMVYRLAYARTRNKADAEDLFQEVFLKCHKANQRFSSEEHCKAWLIRVTVNLSKNLLTSAWKKKIVLKDEPSWNSENYSTSLLENDKGEVFYEVLKLPEKYRIVIHLYYYEDYSVSEIANILNRKDSTVKTQLFRARELLKQNLKGEYDYV
jgi:RNA polymerase sigma-70 factor (ECF subfamily)